MSEPFRTEQYISALGSGRLVGASRDVIHAAASAARYNKLANVLWHLDGNRNGTNFNLCAQFFASYLVKNKVETSRDSWDVANDSLQFWLFHTLCHGCHGTGVLNAEQTICPTCNGMKEMPKPRHIEKGLGEINSALDWYERQIQAKMRNAGGDPLPRAIPMHVEIQIEDEPPLHGWYEPIMMGHE